MGAPLAVTSDNMRQHIHVGDSILPVFQKFSATVNRIEGNDLHVTVASETSGTWEEVWNREHSEAAAERGEYLIKTGPRPHVVVGTMGLRHGEMKAMMSLMNHHPLPLCILDTEHPQPAPPTLFTNAAKDNVSEAQAIKLVLEKCPKPNFIIDSFTAFSKVSRPSRNQRKRRKRNRQHGK
jgi:hypothetical protein